MYGEPEAVQAQAMNSLKVYFENETSSLSSDPSILPLLALPFVNDPLTHPIFFELFEVSMKDFEHT